MGVDGLCVSTGSPTYKNKDGVFWSYCGISLTKEEAIKKLKKKAKRHLDERYTDEAFFIRYIEKYNAEVDGHDYYEY